MEPSGRDIFNMGIGIPALLAWIAYGLCWLIEPRLTTDQNPLVWAACAAGGWYLIIGLIVGGPCILMGL